MPSSLPTNLSGHSVKERLVTRWREVQAEERQQQQSVERATHPAAGAHVDFVTHEQCTMFAALQTYSDLVVGNRPYPSSLKDAGG